MKEAFKIIIIMITYNGQLHNSKFGLVTAFMGGTIYAVDHSESFTGMLRLKEWFLILEFIVNHLAIGGISFIGGILLKYLWELVLKKIDKNK